MADDDDSDGPTRRAGRSRGEPEERVRATLEAELAAAREEARQATSAGCASAPTSRT